MNETAIIAIVAQIGLLWYAYQSVFKREDRRKPDPNDVDAMRGAILFAAVVLIASVVMIFLADGRRFIAVRKMYELGYIASCFAFYTAIRILRGKPYRHDTRTNDD